MTTRLAQPDSRPLLVTLVIVGWLILSGFGGARALVVLGNAASTSYFGVKDPMSRLAIEAPDLVTEEARQHLAMTEALQQLGLQLAGPLLGLALVGIIGAIRLLRRRPGSRALLLAVGLGVIGLTGYHVYASLQITTLGPVAASGLQEAEEMLPALFAVAGINVALQSLPLVLVMSLLRHPIVARYAALRSEGP